jgi:hypothetical protein
MHPYISEAALRRCIRQPLTADGYAVGDIVESRKDKKVYTVDLEIED